MFTFMPLIFTFMFATFPAGLVIYYTWNNLLTVTPAMVHHAPRRAWRFICSRICKLRQGERRDAARMTEIRAQAFRRAVRLSSGAPATSTVCRRRACREVAFVGRSNVGKSCLINALTGRKTVARVCQTPGRTREINFFNLGGKLMLVDLPGYGYAKASKNLAMEWQTLIFAYLSGRATPAPRAASDRRAARR